MQKTKTEYNLLEIRKKSLEQMVHGSIRPHGKLRGMDVFSWTNPEMEAITSTIHAFPFSVIWLAPSGLLMSVIENDPDIMSNLYGVISYDNTQRVFDSEKFGDVRYVLTTNDVKQAFQEMNALQLKRGIILFCSAGSDVEMYENAFREYLGLHQI